MRRALRASSHRLLPDTSHRSEGTICWGFSKKIVKGEDKLLVAPAVPVPAFCTPMAVFGVFDGHGGKQTAELIVRELVGALQEELVRARFGTTDRYLGMPAAAATHLPSPHRRLPWHLPYPPFVTRRALRAAYAPRCLRAW